MPLKTKIRTYLSLGFKNIVSVFLYRVLLKKGYFIKKCPIKDFVPGPFFTFCKDAKEIPYESPWKEGYICFFDYHKIGLKKETPRWNGEDFPGNEYTNTEKHWSEIPDFSSSTGDIKVVWELSRFNWLTAFSLAYVSTLDKQWLNKLNLWLEDWSLSNPANKGANWKCGQEASIRVIHLALVSYILNQHNNPMSALVLLIQDHLRRIEPTIGYAMAQDNNHGTSEAAALFIGSSLILQVKHGDLEAIRWYKKGRKWLENRVAKLIADDGSFSQYSTNYHRLLLDTLSFTEFWRRLLNKEKFSKTFYSKSKKASFWLYAMTCRETGRVPNIGANDGTRLLQLSQTAYDDFRPSVQMATVLFYGKRAYNEPSTYDEALKWLNIDIPDERQCFENKANFSDGGFLVFKSGEAKVVFRYPNFCFRPSHADALHLDFWLEGENVLRDGGTYSYNTTPDLMTYFSGVESHNTVQFDSNDQMPRLSRFLFGDWLKCQETPQMKEDDGALICSASYIGRFGEYHKRKLSFCKNRLKIEDDVSGFKQSAILRWRLKPCNWEILGHRLKSSSISMDLSSSGPIKRFELVEGLESLFYSFKSTIPVLEVEVNESCILTTVIEWGTVSA